MRELIGSVHRIAIISIALPWLAGCGGIAHLDCDAAAQRALSLSQDRPIRFVTIANARETTRNETDLRCTGDATLADGGTTPVYIRAHEENGHVDIAYQGVPYP